MLEEALALCNTALSKVSAATRKQLSEKLASKQQEEGKGSVTEGDRRRWSLPATGKSFEHWTVPFEADNAWPAALRRAVVAYRTTWRKKQDEIDACIAANGDQEDLLDEPEIVKGVLRVTGPFTVEGVRPAELSLGSETSLEVEGTSSAGKNLHAYLTRMVHLLRDDGLTFLDNKVRRFHRLEAVFEASTGSAIHAEGSFDESDPEGSNAVAVGFGPQYGPVTAEQVEGLIRASKRYDELVIAGFSFDAEASAALQDVTHPALRVHQAYIRPDENAAMDGLLKPDRGSQLFSVFGQPEVILTQAGDGCWTCDLAGVDIYDPVNNIVRSTGAEKVAAWFLDTDYDGRCFCISQAFFPDKTAWEKIAKALGLDTDAEPFSSYSSTTSLPFRGGESRKIAVKVIDPRGNEVMTVRKLED
ncbi:MAG: hypothetical protein JKY65_01795 [Planctomycetes bacterium]|nr:hypothetical protein [Planctomycetota bacterium]